VCSYTEAAPSPPSLCLCRVGWWLMMCTLCRMSWCVVLRRSVPPGDAGSQRDERRAYFRHPQELYQHRLPVAPRRQSHHIRLDHLLTFVCPFEPFQLGYSNKILLLPLHSFSPNPSNLFIPLLHMLFSLFLRPMWVFQVSCSFFLHFFMRYMDRGADCGGPWAQLFLLVIPECGVVHWLGTTVLSC